MGLPRATISERQGYRSGIAEDEIPIVARIVRSGLQFDQIAEQGAGLGLPIAKSLIDMHGGTFTLNRSFASVTEGHRSPPAGARDVCAGSEAENLHPWQNRKPPAALTATRSADPQQPIMSAGTGL